ncbi:MAG: hypothetical protein ACE1ZI_06970, partial [Acidobacteriota bacterium]
QGTFLENAGRAAFAASGLVLSAIYMLWMYQRVFMGTLASDSNRTLADLNVRETVILVPIVILMLWMGSYPSTFLGRMETSVQKVVDRIEEVRAPQTFRVEYRGD